MPGSGVSEAGTMSLGSLLKKYSAQGSLVREAVDGRIECVACGHRCRIGPGREGICRVRYNDGGRLMVPRGYVGGVQLDPVEKKPFYHVLPGSRALSFGMLGCDYHCSYCQNWITSQAVRDPGARPEPDPVDAENLVRIALEYDAAIITSTYNEPLITSEWAVEIFTVARTYGLLTSYVSNGNGTPEVVDFLKPWVDAYKVDLKGFDDRRYRQLGGVLTAVLDTIVLLHEKKFWVEIVTLVVPGFNDSDRELREMAGFIASVSPDIPWHVTAFHPDYRMDDVASTPVRSLLRAATIGREAGLRFVYAGNLPGLVGEFENTICPSCGETVIGRSGFSIVSNRMVDGCCGSCGAQVPGLWHRAPVPAAGKYFVKDA
jgi:pyruvate formate lyase activating enzyme